MGFLVSQTGIKPVPPTTGSTESYSTGPPIPIHLDPVLQVWDQPLPRLSLPNGAWILEKGKKGGRDRGREERQRKGKLKFFFTC